MGLNFIPTAPSINALKKSDTFTELQPTVDAKMLNVKIVARLLSTPYGRKIAQRAKEHSPLPYEKGLGRRHA